MVEYPIVAIAAFIVDNAVRQTFVLPQNILNDFPDTMSPYGHSSAIVADCVERAHHPRMTLTLKRIAPYRTGGCTSIAESHVYRIRCVTEMINTSQGSCEAATGWCGYPESGCWKGIAGSFECHRG